MIFKCNRQNYPDLPEWLRFTQRHPYDNGFLYGTPTSPGKSVIEVWRQLSGFTTRKHMILSSYCNKLCRNMYNTFKNTFTSCFFSSGSLYLVKFLFSFYLYLFMIKFMVKLYHSLLCHKVLIIFIKRLKHKILLQLKWRRIWSISGKRQVSSSDPRRRRLEFLCFINNSARNWSLKKKRNKKFWSVTLVWNRIYYNLKTFISIYMSPQFTARTRPFTLFRLHFIFTVLRCKVMNHIKPSIKHNLRGLQGVKVFWEM